MDAENPHKTRIGKIRTLICAGNYIGAISVIDSAEESNIEYVFYKGICSLGLGDFQSAHDALKTTVIDVADPIEKLLRLAELKMFAGFRNEAEDKLEGVIKIDKHNELAAERLKELGNFVYNKHDILKIYLANLELLKNNIKFNEIMELIQPDENEQETFDDIYAEETGNTPAGLQSLQHVGVDENTTVMDHYVFSIEAHEKSEEDQIRRESMRAEWAAREKLNVVKCPLCGEKMILRTATQGAYKGRQFYGCGRYPACKGIRSL